VACICGVNPVSVALHASQGFTAVGTLPEAGFKFGKWMDMSMMRRPLLARPLPTSEEVAVGAQAG
jgi:phosphinothricin acetyltransferase